MKSILIMTIVSGSLLTSFFALAYQGHQQTPRLGIVLPDTAKSKPQLGHARELGSRSKTYLIDRSSQGVERLAPAGRGQPELMMEGRRTSKTVIVKKIASPEQADAKRFGIRRD